jgi:hypothetical protein
VSSLREVGLKAYKDAAVSQDTIVGATANPKPVKEALFKKFLLFIEYNLCYK